MADNILQQKKIKKNYLFNLIFQIVSFIIPLLTMPYVSKILGSDGIGQYSFAYSIVSYFVLIGAFGFGYYGQREIATHQGDIYKQSKIFWEILISRSIVVFFVLILYVFLVSFGVFKEYTSLMWVLILNILAVVFDISFFYQGNEDFVKLTTITTIVKFFGLVLIFIFVKNKNDVIVYTLCHSLIVIIPNIILWLGIKNKIIFINIKWSEMVRHFKPAVRFFIPTIAISLYTILDKTMIGLLVDGEKSIILNDGTIYFYKIADAENGFYEQSEKIVKIVLTIITSLGTIMLPRNSNALSNGDKNGFNNNINLALDFVTLIGLPLMFGISAISFNFTNWFFSDGHDRIPYLIMLMSPLIILIGFSNVLGLQYLIPLKKEKKYMISICMGAIINLILNFCLIPTLISFGAAISTVVAEFIITFIMFYFAKVDISFKRLLQLSWKRLIAGIVMFIIVFALSFVIYSSFINTLLLIIIGAIIYLSILVALKDSFLKKVFHNTNK